MGTWAILVSGGVGHSPAGGLTTPTNTMFQLAPVQLRHSVLREIHCCWGPAPTLPSMRASDIHPPLAHPFFWWSTMSPRTCMRRKGTACETAHRSEEHTSELQSRQYLVSRLLLEKKKK